MKTKTNRTTDTKPTNPSVMQRTPFMNSIGWQPSPKPSRSTLVRSTLYALTLYALSTHHTFAQSWSTVDDFQYVAGQGAYNAALAVAPNGTLLAAGSGYDGADVGHALVMSSADGGITWTTSLAQPWKTIRGTRPSVPTRLGTFMPRESTLIRLTQTSLITGSSGAAPTAEQVGPPLMMSPRSVAVGLIKLTPSRRTQWAAFMSLVS